MPAEHKGLSSYKEERGGDPKFSEALADECGEAANADLRGQQEGILPGCSEEVFKEEVRMVKTSSVEFEHCFALGIRELSEKQRSVCSS